jgi:prevent-host-death family protein
MQRIGIRELRQHASRYLSQVAAGETVEVTDRGRPVALIVPVGRDPWHELVAAGMVSPVDDKVDLLDEAPADYGVAASAVLAAARENER